MNIDTNLIRHSLLAGFLIGIGVIINIMTGDRVLGSVYFSFGLLTIICFDLKLFTGKVGNFQNYKFSELWDMYLWNCVGCSAAMLFYLLSNPQFGEYLIPIAEAKFDKSFIELFFAGILCGALVHLAVKSKNVFITIAAISIFILVGAEHCIADWPFAWFYTKNHDAVITGLKYLSIIIGNSIGAIGTEFFLKK